MEEFLLHQYCEWDYTQKVEKLLAEVRGIDLTYKDGIFFQLAIRNQNTKILEALLKYYKYSELQGDVDSIEYKNSLKLLKEIFDDAFSTNEISPEIQKIVSNYIFKETDINSKVEERFNKNYPFAYKNIREIAESISNKAQGTLYSTKVQEINLPPDLSNKSSAYNKLKDLQYICDILHPQIQQNIHEINDKQKLTTDELNLNLLKWELEGCQFHLKLFIKDLELESPELLKNYNSSIDNISIAKNVADNDSVLVSENVQLLYNSSDDDVSDKNLPDTSLESSSETKRMIKNDKENEKLYKEIRSKFSVIKEISQDISGLRQIKNICLPRNFNEESYKILNNLGATLGDVKEEIKEEYSERSNIETNSINAIKPLMDNFSRKLTSFLDMETQHMGLLNSLPNQSSIEANEDFSSDSKVDMKLAGTLDSDN